MQLRHILLATDLSENAQRAYTPVCDVARITGAKITLFHVVFTLTQMPAGASLGTLVGPPDYEIDRRTAVHALEEQARLLDPELDVTLRVMTGQHVAKTVVKYVEQNAVDLVALSTHGRSGLGRVVLGSVADEILRHIHVPTLCFPPSN